MNSVNSRRPILVGTDGQPLEQSFAPAQVAETQDAEVSPDGKTVKMIRPLLPQINKEIFQAFFKNPVHPASLEKFIVENNPLVLAFMQMVEDNIDHYCTTNKEKGLSRDKSKKMLREVAYVLYWLLQSQLEYDKAQAAIRAWKEKENAVSNQESGTGEVQGVQEGDE